MLLLYPRSDTKCITEHLIFTFHYASTLSVQHLSSEYYLPTFTFHYASTLSRLTGIIQGQLNLIYIPLCFYFIYTITLIYILYIVIYIPLCFYFIQQQRSEQQPSWHIYIPLCFYFIDISDKPCVIYGKHLHSTMLLLYQMRSG